MELDSCHLLAAYNFGLEPRFLESLCAPALCSYAPFQYCAPIRWKAATLSVVEKKVCCVFRRCNCAVRDYEKTGLQTKSPQTSVNSFNRSFIHSIIRLTNFVTAIHGLAVKQEDKFPTIATQTELRKLTATDALSFSKYQGVWHMMYSKQRGDTLRSCPTRRMRGIRHSNAPRWTNVTLYGINGDRGMRLWKSTIKPEIYSDDATYLWTSNSEMRRGEFKGTWWKHHAMKTEPNIYIVKWKLHEPGWLYNEIGESITLQYIKSRYIIRMQPK